MSRFVSRRNPVSFKALKRKACGSVVVHHNGNWEDVKFTRIRGGWIRQRTDVNWVRPEVVSSAAVANECNHAFGDRSSWAKVY